MNYAILGSIVNGELNVCFTCDWKYIGKIMEVVNVEEKLTIIGHGYKILMENREIRIKHV